jgi:hypothetical protein
LRLMSCLFLFSMCQAAAAQVPVKMNSRPAEPPRVLGLEPLWTVGGDDYMFGLMIEAITDVEGNVYLLDQQLNHATVVSPEGEILRELGREGDGPGEVRTPQDLIMTPDGAVAFAQQMPGKFIKVSRDGVPAGNFDMTLGGDDEAGFSIISTCAHRGDVMIVGSLRAAPIENGQSRSSYLSLIDAEGNELTRYREHKTILDFQKPHFVESEMLACFLGAYAIGPGGRVYCARDRNSYAIEAYKADGTLEMVIERDFTNRPRTQRELDRMNELFEVQDRNLPFAITWEVEDSDQTLTGLHVDGDGRLWVQHNNSTHGQPSGVMVAYDVFDEAGRWLHEVQIKADADPAHDGLIFLDDGRILLVKGLVLARMTASGSQGAVFDEDGQAGELEVICCRPVEL